MALPKLLQKLFANGGVGPRLRPDIMPIQTVDGYAPDASGNVDTKRLPLIGGTMTGPIESTCSSRLPTIKNTNGAQLWLMKLGDSTYDGGFVLRSKTEGDVHVDLAGYPDGRLTWGAKSIVRSVNSMSAGASGNVSVKCLPDFTTGVQTVTSTEGWTAPYDCYVVIYREQAWTQGHMYQLKKGNVLIDSAKAPYTVL